MPVSENGKFYFLHYGESVDFKLANLDHAVKTMQNGRIVELGHRFARHFSNKPFPNGRLVYPCEGPLHCEMCMAKLKPTTLFSVEVMVDEGEGPSVYMMDMRASAHTATLVAIQELLDKGATLSDVSNTTFRLERLGKGERPWFVCQYITKFEEPQTIDVISLTQDEMDALKSIDAWLRMHPEVKNTRGSVIKTLRERDGWSEEKILYAFETVLNEYGYLRAGNE